MGFLEAAVVIYLRKLYYPGGFEFPLKPLPDQIAFTELGRELSTLVMLITVGMMLGRSGLGQFAYFLLCFAIWDIVYYIGLKVVLDWPESLLTWDILFLIPIPWTGPLVVPLAAAFSMIILSFLLIRIKRNANRVKVKPMMWVYLISGALIFILACVWDYATFVISNFGWASLYTLDREAVFAVTKSYIPDQFPWIIWGISMLLIWLGIGNFGWHNRKQLSGI